MYSPPIKYDDFLQKFPTEANAFQFYQKSCGIYCPSCGDKQFSYLRDEDGRRVGRPSENILI